MLQKENVLSNNDLNLGWHPESWKSFSALQQPEYLNRQEYSKYIFLLKQKTRLVREEEILKLKNRLAKAGLGQEFILQAGDCAESFDECVENIVHNKINQIFSLSDILEKALQKNIVSIGRIAGQYAKPRSKTHENIDGVSLPCYRGDMINGFSFNEDARIPNPARLLTAYHCAQKTLNYAHTFSIFKQKSLYTSHEALHLDYESSLTKLSFCSYNGKEIYKDLPEDFETKWQYCKRNYGAPHYYNYSAHMVWLGERTRQLDGAHVEYLKGIQNPIGIKVGPNICAQELCTLIQTLNPLAEHGKIVLITRLGYLNVEKVLPKLIQEIQKFNFPVCWSVDPMHGNTRKLSSGLKIRYFNDIFEEVKLSAQIHKNFKSILSGLHLETSPLNMKECEENSYEDKNLQNQNSLQKNYLSLCDPRLNKEQAERLVTLAANEIR